MSTTQSQTIRNQEREIAGLKAKVQHLENIIEGYRRNPSSKPRDDVAMKWVKQYMQNHPTEWIRVISMVDNSDYTYGIIHKRLQWLVQLGLVVINDDNKPPLYSWVIAPLPPIVRDTF